LTNTHVGLGGDAWHPGDGSECNLAHRVRCLRNSR
jgi:hypothetical protein